MAFRYRAGMIRSVSILSPRSGTAVPERSRMRLPAIRELRADELTHVNQLAGDRRGGDHRGTHQQRASGRTALPPLEVAVRGRGADLPPLETIGIHREAHRASGAAPLEAGVGRISAASSTTSSSYGAPRSDAIDDHHAHAASNASPCGAN